MSQEFLSVDPKSLNENVFTLIGKEWTLITAGTLEAYNTMTASWGGLGILWNKNVCTIYVRTHRYTREFLEKNNTFTLSFFDDSWRSALNLCGSKSGRDVDKAAETGLIPVEGQHGAVYFEQARLVLECRKLYYQDLEPEHFLDPEIHKMYPLKDYHRVYIGEILSVLKK